MPLRRRPIARIATTAVVAGTAANMGARSAQRSAAAAAEAQAEPPAPAPVDETPAPEATESTEVEQLKQYAALRDQGILTEEEFAAKKAQILGI
jgi:Short C-terminal domain